jgi:hypothetical protein
MMAERAASRALVEALERDTRSTGRGAPRQLTVADAAAKSGLALRDAEPALHALVAEYRGHLRVTSDGELLFHFPSGFTKPWVVRDAWNRLLTRAAHTLGGIGRFVVRAWITVVLVGYAVIFLTLIVAVTFARSSSGSRDSRGALGIELGYVFLRALFEALFWTFHPFSPFAFGNSASVAAVNGTFRSSQRRNARRDGTSFYESVNRFFFGPDVPEPDARDRERRMLAEIRAQKGRIGLSDVMRVTGLSRDEAHPFIARLMLDYDGTVEVSSEGGIVYRFEALRRTVDARADAPRPEPAWSQKKRLPPLTGNSLGANVLIAGLNGFNLIMSLYALGNELTLARLAFIFEAMQHGVPRGAVVPGGTAVVLGVVPLVFSVLLFLLPVARAAIRPFKERRIARQNGSLAVLKTVLTSVSQREISDASLRRAWKAAAGSEPDPRDITREVVALGGDVDMDSDHVRYRFADLELEAHALLAEREAASAAEAQVGKVVFSSED